MEKALILTFLGMGVVTYLPRALPLLGLSRLALPRLFLVWLSMVPAAVLAALTAQSLVGVGLHGLEPKGLDTLVALPCLLIAVRTRSMMVVVLVGMGLMVLGRSVGLAAGTMP